MILRQLCLSTAIATVIPVALAAQEKVDAEAAEAFAARVEVLGGQRATRPAPSWNAVSLNGVLGFIAQGQRSSGAADAEGPSGRGVPFQPEISIRPSRHGELFVKLGFAAGGGLNSGTDFVLAPWGGDLAHDVKDLSGGARDHLLAGWYQHSFERGGHSLVLRGGIIDAADHIDRNAYSNDEYAQFMNAALVNAPNTFLVSYEPGVAVEWNHRWFTASAVAMAASENDSGRDHEYYAAQLMATLDLGIGEGNYRLVLSRGSEDFLDPAGEQLDAHSLVLLSFDQELTPWLGAWIRVGRQDTDILVDYQDILSGGLQLSGSFLGREGAIGLGYAHLTGGRQTDECLERTAIFETYGRLMLDEHLAVTVDLQHMHDEYVPAAAARDLSGWIAGLRLTVEF